MRISPRLSQALNHGSAHGIRASFWRGGTSKALMLHGPNLPAWSTLSPSQKSGSEGLRLCEKILAPFFNAAMGSPDPVHGRQLNGLGGGVSSLSKAIIVERASTRREDSVEVKGVDDVVDVNYWFIQVGIRDGKLDMAGNCGNMTSAVAPFAVMQGLAELESATRIAEGEEDQEGRGKRVTIRLRNMNTNKRISAEISVVKHQGQWVFNGKGDYEIDGVSGTASPIILTFLDPAGSKTGKALPTGTTVDTLVIDGHEIKASLTDISNPGVFIDGRDVGWDPDSHPDQLTANTELMTRLEAIRREGARRMGLDPDVPSIPKIVLVYPPHSDEVDVRCQALSMQQAHKAVPVTLALKLGVACKLKGTIPFELARKREGSTNATVIVGHPSGRIDVGAEIEGGKIVGAKLVRTARWLMDGVVNDEM